MMLKMFCIALLALAISGNAACALAMPKASRKIAKKTCARSGASEHRRRGLLIVADFNPRILTSKQAFVLAIRS